MRKALVLFTAFTVAAASYTYYKDINAGGKLKACYAKVTDIYDSVTINGTVYEKERNNLFPKEPIMIEEIYIREGDHVKKGDILFKVSPSSYQPYTDISVFMESTMGQSLWGNMISCEVSDGYIKSPFEGVVMSVNCSENSETGVYNMLAAISDVSQLQVISKVSEDLVGKLKPEMKGELTFPAIDGKTYSGVISEIMPYAVKSGNFFTTGNSMSKTEVVEEILDNDGQIRPGYSVNTKIVTDIRSSALVLPYEYICQGDDGKEYVYVLNKNGRAELRYVETGYELQTVTEIISGISASDLILLPTENIEQIEKITVRTEYENE